MSSRVFRCPQYTWNSGAAKNAPTNPPTKASQLHGTRCSTSGSL